MERKKSCKYCNNCGAEGHQFASCNDPITSIGIVCMSTQDAAVYNILSTQLVLNPVVNGVRFSANKACINIQKTNSYYLGETSDIKKYIDKLRFVMIQRKHSLGYIEFIRGKYLVDDYQHIIHLFQQMQQKEINNIAEWDFERLWVDLWKETAALKMFKSDFEASRKKFYELKNASGITSSAGENSATENSATENSATENSAGEKSAVENSATENSAGESSATENSATENSAGESSAKPSTSIVSLNFYVRTIEPINKQEEWGFPKGRRNFYESNLACAVREFMEETGLERRQFVVLDSIQPIVELFVGTNGLKYKHIYHIALLNNDSETLASFESKSSTKKFDALEVGDIGLFSYVEATQIIRDYHVAKKNVLNEIFRFVVTLFKVVDSGRTSLSVYGTKTKHDIVLT